MTLKDLDTVLGHLYGHQDFILFEDIKSGVSNVRQLTSFELLALLNKLIKDGYVERKMLRGITTTEFTGRVIGQVDKPSFIITFEGIQFYRNVPDEYKNMPYQYQGMPVQRKPMFSIYEIVTIIFLSLSAIIAIATCTRT